MTNVKAGTVQTEPRRGDAIEAVFASAEGAALAAHYLRPNTPLPFYVIPQVKGADAPALGAQELLSIQAILAHIAQSQDVRQDTLQQLVEAEFSVAAIKDIPQRRLHDVMEFLIDLRMDCVRSKR